MAKNKTIPTVKSVASFLNEIENDDRKADCFALVDIYRKVTGFEAVMWGPTIVGFGTCHYKYASGREGDMPLACFSPRKNAIVLYQKADALKSLEFVNKFGKYKASKGCIYIQALSDINVKLLEKSILLSVKDIKKRYPAS